MGHAVDAILPHDTPPTYANYCSLFSMRGLLVQSLTYV